MTTTTTPAPKARRTKTTRLPMTTGEFVGGLADAAAPEPAVVAAAQATAPTPTTKARRTTKATPAAVASPEPPPAPTPDLRQTITWTDERPIMERTNGAMAIGQTLKVTDARTYGIAAELIVAGKDLIKEVRAYFEADRQMADALHKSITRKISDAIGRIQPTIDRLSRECQDWRNNEERKRLAAQAQAAADERRRQDEIAEAAAAELRAGGMHEAADAVVEETRLAAQSMPMSVSVASTVPDSPLTFRDNWEWTIVDESKIPREYFLLDEKSIGAVVRAQKGLCRIPGIQVKNNPIPVSSPRRG
jgi:hypothetical protein